MDKNVKNGQNDEMDEATASLSSQKVLGAAARGLVCLNRLICWYVIEGSRDKNINYLFIFSDQNHGEFPALTLCLNRAQLFDLGFIYVGW